MKKILVIILTVLMILGSGNTIYAASNYYVYTSSGIMESVSAAKNDSLLSALACPGAVVQADRSVFSKLLSKSEGIPYNEYVCYGSDNSPETLTLGIVDNDYRQLSSSRQMLQNCVNRQVAYIESIGGVMTGYAVVTDNNANYSIYNEALNISWDVGQMHHYARFELVKYNATGIGYYDLMYTSDSFVQNDISAMNESFYVLYEYQG